MRSGFENAWVVSSEATLVSTPASGAYSSDEYSVDTYSYESADESAYDSDSRYESSLDDDLSSDRFDTEGSRYSMPASEPADIPGFNAPIREDRDKEHQLISEPPEDYRLHELNRDQAALDWSSPFLLASNEAHVIAAALAAHAETAQATPKVVENSADAEVLAPIMVDIADDEPLVLQQWDHKQADVKIDGKLEETAWHHAMAIQQLKVNRAGYLAYAEI